MLEESTLQEPGTIYMWDIYSFHTSNILFFVSRAFLKDLDVFVCDKEQKHLLFCEIS